RRREAWRIPPIPIHAARRASGRTAAGRPTPLACRREPGAHADEIAGALPDTCLGTTGSAAAPAERTLAGRIPSAARRATVHHRAPRNEHAGAGSVIAPTYAARSGSRPRPRGASSRQPAPTGWPPRPGTERRTTATDSAGQEDR